jgi:hypothetical protein
MAAEPEKKIEELLQSYSRKRREDAGAPLEMHPATRRMLQGEAARTQGGANSASPRPWWKALLLFGPKYAGAIGMFAILALGVWVITQQDDRSTTVRQEASERRAGADAHPARSPGELAQRESEKLNEVDDELARAPSPSKEAELSKAGRGFREQEKVQTRDADGSPLPATAAMPAPPQVKLTEELVREKQVPLQNEPQVGQRIANVVAGGAGASVDKSSAGLADKPVAPEEQFYKRSEAKADALGVPAPAMQPITARLDLAAAKSALTNHYAYAVTAAPVTNVARGAEAAAALYAGVELATTTTNARGEKLLAFSDTVMPGATEWTAVPAEQPAKNELDRARELQVRSRVAQEAESREGVSPALLRRFSVEQNDGTIRIRDAEDGSVYVGEMLAVSDSNVDGKAKDVKDEFRQSDRNVEEARSAPRAFRARGINQRSQQIVIINGELTEEQERPDEIVGKSVALVSGATAPAAPPSKSPAPTSTASSPADARSLRRRDQATPGEQPSQSQTGAAFRSMSAAAPAVSTGATAASTSAVFRATTLRARVQIGPTNELNFRAIRTR